MYFKTKQDGNISTLSLIYTKSEKASGYFFLIFFVLIFITLITVSILFDSLFLFIVAVILPGPLIILIYLYIHNNPELQINLRERLLYFEGEEYEVNVNDQIILRRRFDKQKIIDHSTMASTRSTTTIAYVYQAVWEFVYHRYNNNELKLGFTYVSNPTAFNKFVETIAELLNISLIDETGIEPLAIKKGETDVSLRERIGKRTSTEPLSTDSNHANLNIRKENGNWIIEKKFQEPVVGLIVKSLFLLLLAFVSSSLGKYAILTLMGSLSDAWAVRLVIPLIFSLIILALIVWMRYIINSLKFTDTFTISAATVTHLHERIWRKRELLMLTDEIERLIVVDMGDEHGVEIVSANVRLTINRGYDLDEAKQLKQFIETCILST